MSSADKLRMRNRKIRSFILPAVIFASVGVIAVPVPPIHLHLQGIAANVTQSITNPESIPQQ